MDIATLAGIIAGISFIIAGNSYYDSAAIMIIWAEHLQQQ